MCNLLHHFSSYFIALNPICTAYTLSSTYPNCLSSLQHMEPMPSQVRNHYSQSNQAAHLEWAPAFKTLANRHCPASVCLTIIGLWASYYGWLLSANSLVKKDYNINQELSDDDGQDITQFIFYCDMEEHDLDQQHEVLPLGQAHWNKWPQTARDPWPMKPSRVNTVISCPPLANSRNPSTAMAPPLLKAKCQQS